MKSPVSHQGASRSSSPNPPAAAGASRNDSPDSEPAASAAPTNDFDSQLEQARQLQRMTPLTLPALPTAVATPAPLPPVAGDNIDAGKHPTDGSHPAGEGDTATLAAAMLSMLGQAPHALPARSEAKGDLPGRAAAAGLQANGVIAADAASTTIPAAITAAGAAMMPALNEIPAERASHKDAATTDMQAMTTSLSLDASQANNSAAHSLRMQAPVASATFAQELSQQVAWLGGQDIKQARIRLHPEELGQLDVKVSVEHGRVDVSFTAQHPAAVTAVQQSLTQLDTMLAGQGLSLGQAHVGQQGQGGAAHGQATGDVRDVDGTGGEQEVLLQRVGVGLVDAFA
ncbi:flagellar hook-length control protein FliK [Dyella silvatica]|uniref:flagellar hook-length control protein FliK n=1 Tax=Dyella silvatica TaxID=2992128 RepID=UPI0022537F08|nr:flagellar hook-length control protein FliK [Dyella silvatica]